MKDSIRKLLLDADDETQCEWPPEFDRERSLDRVRAVKPIIEKALGCNLDLDGSIQDASYFASLALWKYFPPNPKLYTAPGVKSAGTYNAVIDI